MFDEQRYFAPGDRFRSFATPFGRAGILVCEDIWHLSSAYILSLEGVDMIICPSSSPGRGITTDERLGTAESYALVCRTYAQFLTTFFLYCNRVGFEDGANFWGGSMVIGPNGDIIAQQQDADEALVLAHIDLADVRRERLANPLLPSTSFAESGMSVPASLSEPVFPPLQINPELVRKILVGFIQNEVRKVGFERVVLGLSGGVDSSLVATLAAEALGPKNVLGVIMPYRTSDPKSMSDALQVVRQLGIEHLEVDITPQIDAYFARFLDADPRRRGNKMARERKSIEYDQSSAFRALVIGTSNKTELLLGYGTIYGDMASAINPIGDLYKTQVWQLADAVGVPTAIVQKAPSADLWSGQSDETELGFQYRMIDQLLYYLVDRRYSVDELKGQGFDQAFITEIVRRVRENQYKRRLPLIAKLSSRTIDREFRYPRDWGR